MKKTASPDQRDPNGAPASGASSAKGEGSAGEPPPGPVDPGAGPGEPRGDGPESEGGPGRELTPQEIEDLERRANDRDLYRNELLRLRADFDNYQKRVNRERPQLQELAVRRFVIDLLPVLDNFDRALGKSGASLETIRDGIRIVQGMLSKCLEDHGIEEVAALGKPFDPALHEAVVQEESGSYPPNSVSEVLQKGYTHRGTLVRAAQVKVARPATRGEPHEGKGGAPEKK